MTDKTHTQLYLQTPLRANPAGFPDLLKSVLDAQEIACLRLNTAARLPDEIRRLADVVREVAHARDVPVLIDAHFRMVPPLGLDGVHLLDGLKQMRDARKVLGPDGIIGAFCGTSRHTGMTAAEMTADYVAFGPMLADPLLGDGSAAGLELFQWWSDMIEVPVVAEGGISADAASALSTCADFICLGDEVWLHADGPVTALTAYASLLR